MKKAILLALAGVITLGSFANHKHKVAKQCKKANTTVCPPSCPRTHCSHS